MARMARRGVNYYLIDILVGRGVTIMPLMLRTVCCVMAGALALYYRSLGTAPTLLRRGNILN
jgi:hypothetical protein